jgi:hypothetical protein
LYEEVVKKVSELAYSVLRRDGYYPTTLKLTNKIIEIIKNKLLLRGLKDARHKKKIWFIADGKYRIADERLKLISSKWYFRIHVQRQLSRCTGAW